MARRGKKYEIEVWRSCKKRNGLLVTPRMCEEECGGVQDGCEPQERRVRKGVI